MKSRNLFVLFARKIRQGVMSARALNSRGQNTVEFLLLLLTVVTLAVSVVGIFHEDLAGAFFAFVGGVLGD